MSEISVIVPARNAEDTIGDALEALAGQDYEGGYEVIVVDNGSSDRTGAIAAAAPGPVRVLRTAGGWAGQARNLAAAEAVGSLLAFTDADCVPTPSWLREGVAAIANADLVQGKVRPDPTAARAPFDRTLYVSGEALYETANLFVRRDLFERLGGFEDRIRADLERPFGEDVQFGWRARRAGARTAFAERAVVHHAVFDRTPGEYVAERRRLGNFAVLARAVPELRSVFFYRRLFLSKRTARFDLALAGVVGAAGADALGAHPAFVVAALLLAVPYAWLNVRQALPWGRRAPVVAIVNLVADGVGATSLLGASVRWRSPVL